MPQTLPTSLLLAAFAATVGTVFVQLKWRATFDQLSRLWLMSVFAFGLAGGPAISVFGWRVGAAVAVLASVAPSVAYIFHMGGTSDQVSERWSVWLYAGLLIGAATAVTLNGRVFVEDMLLVSRLPGVYVAWTFMLAVLGIGLAGAATAFGGLRKAGRLQG